MLKAIKEYFKSKKNDSPNKIYKIIEEIQKCYNSINEHATYDKLCAMHENGWIIEINDGLISNIKRGR